MRFHCKNCGTELDRPPGRFTVVCEKCRHMHVFTSDTGVGAQWLTIRDCPHANVEGLARGYAMCGDCGALLPDEDPDLRSKCK